MRSFRLACVFSAALAGCGSDDSAPPVSHGRMAEAARRELIDKGVNQYLGKTKPVSSRESNGATVYEFSPASGPICLRGEPYRALVREKASENLMVYLQGGGACWSGFCIATAEADDTMPTTGILDDAAASNVVADWDVLYVPYCDGSVFSGDNDVNDEAGVRYHRGLKNLSAAVDIAKARFPNPARILLAGSSAGGYGTIIATAVLRLSYPNTELIVLNDSGVGLSNPDDPAMFEAMVNEWKFTQFIPDSCSDCDDRQMSRLISWGLKNDPTLRVAAFSAYEDGIIGGVFLGMTGPEFKALLLAETDRIHAQYPERFRRLFVEGSLHTVLMLNEEMNSLGGYLTPYDGVTVSDWTRAFVTGSSDWTDHLE